MRILTYTSLFPNAQQPWLGIFVHQRTAALARRPGNAVEVIAPVPYAPRGIPGSKWSVFGRIASTEEVGSLCVHHPRYPLLPKISMALHGWVMLLGSFPLARRLHRVAQFDCIDAHYVYPDGFAAVLLGKLLGVPVVVSARGTDMNLFPSFPTIRPLIHWVLHRADGIVAVSSALGETILELGVPEKKLRIIPNGIDAERFHPADRNMARRKLNLSETELLILSVGTLAPHKGHQFLLETLPALVSHHPNLRAYIVGEGSYRRALEAQARRLAIEGRVSWVEGRPNEELRWWYSAANVTCLLSSREGSPNAVIESLACGTPVVATRVGGIPEIIDSAGLGVLVDQKAESIAAGIERALEQQWDRHALAAQVRQRTWDVVSGEVQESLISAVATYRQKLSSNKI